MDSNISIKIGNDGYPFQEFNGKIFRLYPKERYFSRGATRMHTEVWKFYNGVIQKGCHVHHINSNTWDNRIENLEIKEASKHQREHAKKRFKENPEWAKDFHAKGIEAAKEWHSSEEGIKWHRKQGAETWINRPYKTLICEVCGKEFQTRHAGITKYCHNNCKARALRKRRREERLRLND